MQKIYPYSKIIGLTVLTFMFFLNFPPPPAHAVMIATEYALDQDSAMLSERRQVKAFLKRADVIAQLQAYGISYGEALSRIDSLSDREIATLAGRMDQATAMAGGYEMGSGSLWIIGLLMYTIIFLIVFYFSRAKMKEDLAKSSTVETEEKTESQTNEEEEKPE
jgi:hypothetical protein